MQSQFETKLIYITDFILDLIKSHFDNMKITLHKKNYLVVIINCFILMCRLKTVNKPLV